MTRRFNVRNLLAFAILAIAGTLTVVVVRNFREMPPEEIIESLPRNIDLSLKKINYTETREGKRRWTLVADSAAHNVGEGITLIENIHMTFYDEDRGDMVLSAKRGEIKSTPHEVTVQDSVVVRAPRGYTLFTELLRYSEADRLIRTDKPVRLVSDNMEVTGVGMRLDIQDRTLALLSNVEARLAEARGGRGE